MVDEKDDEKEVQQEAEPKKKKPIVLIIVAVLVLAILAGGGAAAYFFLSAPKGKAAKGPEGKKEQAPTEAAAKEESKESGPIEALEPFVVNLNDTEGTRYLKVVMQLELGSEELKPEIERKMPMIRDEIIMLLSSKSYDDLSTAPGKRSLKRAVVENVNRDLTTGKVTNVYFSDFVIQ